MASAKALIVLLILAAILLKLLCGLTSSIVMRFTATYLEDRRSVTFFPAFSYR